MEGAMLPNYGLAEGEDDFVSKSFSIWCIYNFRLKSSMKGWMCLLVIFPFFKSYFLLQTSFVFSIRGANNLI